MTTSFRLLLLTLIVFPGLFSVSHAAQRPNVLLIVVDDMSPFDLQMYNQRSVLETPTLDRLAQQGVVIDQAYQMGSWSGAVCTPSRHMIMSGRSVWHIPTKRRPKGKQRNENPHEKDSQLVPPNLEQQTLAAVFNRAGYETMRTCKTGNSYEAANKQFTFRKDAMKRGGDEPSGSAWHAERVLEYLASRDERKADKPFLIYYGFSHPHDTRDGTPELLAKYGATNHADPQTIPPAHAQQPALPVNYLPSHPFPEGHPNLRDEVAVSGVWKRRDETTIRNEIGRQFACVENIDRQVDRVLNRLEQSGDLENTLVIFTSDHGMAIGRHGLQGKQNLYEHTWRVPMIVSGPGLPQGTRVAGNVYLMDLLATICDYTKVKAPETNEGLSMLPAIQGKTQTIRETLYGVYCGGTKPGMRSVRRGDWKLIEYDVLDGRVRKSQLFQLSENPHEFLLEHHVATIGDLTGMVPEPHQVNLAEDSRYAEKLQEMRALLTEQMQSHNDPHKLWWQE